MKRYVAMLVALLATLFTVNALAFTPPPAPANGGYVVDQAGKLSGGQIQQLNQKIERINRSTKNELGILVLRDMDGDNIEDAANATYKSWGVGKRGLDNGCLIVISVKERKSRIETGKGVEGEVPDLKASDILKNTLAPHLKRGDFYGGLDATLDSLSSLMETRHDQKADPVPAKSDPIPVTPSRPRTGGCDIGGVGTATLAWPFLLVMIALGAFWFVRAYVRRKQEEEEKRLQELRATRIRREAEMRARMAREQREREEHAAKLAAKRAVIPPPLPVTNVVELHPSVRPTRPAVPRPTVKTPAAPITDASVAAAAAMAAAATAEAAQAKLRREREEADRRKRRVQEEEARRKRERDEEDRRSSYSSSSSSSSSSSFDWGGGSSSGGSGFGGGDSGGGGASGDW